MFTREVSSDWQGQRLDRFVADMWPERSRSFWQRAIARGQVRLDGKPARAGVALKAGQRVEVENSEDSTLRALPESQEFSTRDWPSWVVYHDPEVLVVNKPRGLVVHPSRGHWDDSVVLRLLPWLPTEEGEFRPGVVHRLDRDTTGLMILARTAQAKALLSQAIQEREVIRDYVAFVRGHIKPPWGAIDAPLGRNPNNRLKMAVVFGGRPARTHYRTVATWPSASLVQFRLETGRTHQIRVHCASMGHPVLGDTLYGGRHPLLKLGQMLHAGHLRFVHPTNHRLMEFVEGPPEDWVDLSVLGEPEIIEPTLYPDKTEPTTRTWLNQLGVFSV